MLAGFALSGFAALLYQVVWIHSLVLVIGVSVYAFSTVLTVFLAGIGLGEGMGQTTRLGDQFLEAGRK